MAKSLDGVPWQHREFIQKLRKSVCVSVCSLSDFPALQPQPTNSDWGTKAELANSHERATRWLLTQLRS